MGPFGKIKTEELNRGMKLWSESPNAWLLDTREEDEYWQGHIPGSKNITIVQLERLTSLLNDFSTPLFVYSSTSERSGVACKRLRLMSFSDITDLGSIDAYEGELE